jgi:pyruvate dehydrogenase E2 component (dihydrolipoamide acetyltransferase)
LISKGGEAATEAPKAKSEASKATTSAAKPTTEASKPQPVQTQPAETQRQQTKESRPQPVAKPAAVEMRDGASSRGDGARQNSQPAPLLRATESHPEMSARPSAAPTAIPRPPARESIEQLQPTAARQEGDRVKASPLARRAAEEAQIDLTHVRGSGPDGRITKRDVDNFLREQQLFRQRRLVMPREGAPGSHEELSKMRKTIASRMALSKREIPHFYVTSEIDMEEAVRFKKSIETAELFEEDISFNDIIIKASALALARYPRINASFENDGITIHPDINIGMAVAVADGLIVPVIHQCQALSLPEIARAAHRLVTKAAQGGFTSGELSGATFTISNMGMVGVEHFAAVIIPPQAAILAVSAIKPRPVVRDGHLVAGTTMMVTISCDHRIIDGVVAGRFLQEMKRFLENPASLLIS